MDSFIIDLTIRIVLAGTPIVLSAFIIPWVKAHTDEKEQAKITHIVETLVQTAEQVFGPGTGAIKLEKVTTWLNDKGLDVSRGEIEAAVLRLHAAGHDWTTAHSQDVNNIPSVKIPAAEEAANIVG
ncbi:hypothetical protein FACS18948_3770 [Clostridia bacterium]|nr:hypothetical protein FACS18948_3770 [Clostridia bacterium]